MGKVSTIDIMEAAVHPAVSVKFNGKDIIQIAKRLSKVEIDSCGEFSLINLNTSYSGREKDHNLIEIAKYAELQHKILKLCMINPTYEEVENRLLDMAEVKDLKKRMRKMVDDFHFIKDSKEKAQLEKEFAILEFRAKFFMPQDFLIEMFTFATSQDVSDIKLIVSEEILYDAAVLAKKGHCRVSDVLCEDGIFTTHNKADVDMRGEIIYQERTRKK